MRRKKGNIIIKSLSLPKLPFKTKSEKEMSELINRTNAVARKRQIEMVKLDLLNCSPYSISSYTNTEVRKSLFKKLGHLLVTLCRLPLELRP